MKKLLSIFLCVSFLSPFGYTIFPLVPGKKGTLNLKTAGTLTVYLKEKVPFYDRVEFEIGKHKGEFTPYDKINSKQTFRIEKTSNPIDYKFSFKDSGSFEIKYDPFYVEFIMLRKIVNVNGIIEDIDVAPFFQNEEEMLPVRFVAEFLGADVFWTEKKKKVVIRFLNRDLLLIIGSKTAYFNGKEIVISNAPIIIENRTFLPLSVIEKLFDINVKNRRDSGIITVGGE